MTTSIITIVLAILGGSTGAAIVTAISNRGKNKAQVQHMNIEGDLKIGDNWKEYAKQVNQDMQGIKQELNLVHNKYLDLEKKYNDLYAEHARVVEESKLDKGRIKELEAKVGASEERITELQTELDKYKKLTV